VQPPANSRIAAAAIVAARTNCDDDGARRLRVALAWTNEAELAMEWVLLEAGIALFLAVFIAWWLMRGKK
jgi:hypothetical protein